MVNVHLVTIQITNFLTQYWKGALNIQSNDLHFREIKVEFRGSILYKHLYTWGVIEELRNLHFHFFREMNFPL